MKRTLFSFSSHGLKKRKMPKNHHKHHLQAKTKYPQLKGKLILKKTITPQQSRITNQIHKIKNYNKKMLKKKTWCRRRRRI